MSASLPASPLTDTELVTRTLAGSREAFAEIVTRYQALICSLAYSATGSLSQSQDLSQETFLAAWQQLPSLREPASLRSWLCGIARNLNHRAHRSRHREPTHAAEPLDRALASPAPEAAPAEQTIGREEESILWRSLERIPEDFREPLILFYRQHHSVARVAALLDLSEDAVRQRLSRGRKLLQEEVAAFVEGALARSAPGPTFCATVVAALPLNAGLSAGVVAAKGGGFLSALAPAAVGLAGSLLGSLGLVGLAASPAARRFTIRLLVAMWGDCVALWLALVLSQIGRRSLAWPDRTFVIVQVVIYFCWAAVMAALVVRFLRASIAHWCTAPRILTPVAKPTVGAGFIVAAMTAGSLAWLVQLALAAGDFVSVSIAGLTGLVVFLWVIVLARRLHALGWNPAFVAGAPAAMIGAVILALLNWRFDAWIAALRGTDLAGAQVFLPMGLIHGATLLFVGWVAALVAFTRPASRISHDQLPSLP